MGLQSRGIKYHSGPLMAISGRLILLLLHPPALLNAALALAYVFVFERSYKSPQPKRRQYASRLFIGHRYMGNRVRVIKSGLPGGIRSQNPIPDSGTDRAQLNK